MKKLIVFLAALSLISCSDDDGNKTKNLFLESLTIVSPGNGGGGGAIEFTYNDDKQLKSLSGNGTDFTIGYDEGRIISVHSSGSNGINYELGYQDGKLTTLTKDGTEYEVTLSNDGKTYTIAGLERAFTVNEDNDVASITEGTTAYPFIYDNKYKGPMYSVKAENIFVLQFLLSAPYIFSRRPASDFLTYTAQNTYNSDGYLQKAVLVISGQTEPSATIYYNYTEL